MQDYLTESHDLNSPAIISAFDELPLWSSYPGAMILDAIAFKHEAVILDIGFGSGFPIIEIAQRFGAGAEVIGLDPWAAATVRAREKASTMGIKNISFVDGIAEQMPFPADKFDLIVSNNGLNNTDNQLNAMRESARVLKPGGQFIFTMNLPGTMKEFYLIFENVLDDLLLHEEIRKMGQHISQKRKSVAEITGLIEKSGLQLVHLKKSTFKMRYLNGTAFLNHHFIKLCFLESWIKILPENQTRHIFARLEERLNHYADAHEGLNLTIPLACFDCTK
jgi:ubiquinone/menaquinone biosynthesis C-methylase UbiE